MKHHDERWAAFNEAYASLNAAQKQAVDAIDGPVMVIAGPGTGKTQILTLRIANILLQTDAQPEHILALTFTNSGVRAMRERLHRYIGDEAYRVGIYTFHSFAEHIFQTYSSYFKEREFASVISELEKAQLFEQILDQHDFTEIVSVYDRFSSLRQVMDAVAAIKQEGISPAEFDASIAPWEKEQLSSDTILYKRATGTHKIGDPKPAELLKLNKRVAKAREIATVFSAYQAALRKANRYDFSDMILTLLDELANNEHLKADLQEQYQYLLVDEHQDTNEGQNKLIEFLTDAPHLEGRPNLFTVGDEKQSIYRFQGASEQAFRHFKQHYRDVQVIELSQNYRSTAPILEASHTLITRSLPGTTALQSNQRAAVPITIQEFSDYKFELLFVVNDIKERLDAGVPPEEIAVVYRSNKHLSEIKVLFEQSGIPYQVRSRDTLLDDPVIEMFIALMRVIADPHDDSSLGRLLFAEFLELDALTVADTLRAYRVARRAAKAPQSLIDHLSNDAAYASLVGLITQLVTYSASHHFTETFKEALQTSGFLEHMLTASDSRGLLRKVEVLFNQVRQQAERQASYTVVDFVAFIDATLKYRLSIEVTAATVGTGVQCLTAHGSKGLEFSCVYLLQATRSNWEKSRGSAGIVLPLSRYVGEIDDERRLFYVAITRAKEHLVITSSAQDWSGRALEPSQFISELGVEAVAKAQVAALESRFEPELVRFFSNETSRDSVFTPAYLAARFRQEAISVTALNNYLECPHKYLFRNLIQLPDVYTPALRYGDAVHRALEVFFVQSAEAKHILPKDVLLSVYEEAMTTSGLYEAEYERFLQKGRQSLGMYYDYYHREWSVKVALELYVRTSFVWNNETFTLSGKLDKLEFLDREGEGPVRVVDYKTGKVFSKKSSKAQKEALERQLQFYHVLLRDYKNGSFSVKEAVLDFVEPGETGEFEQKALSVNREDIAALEQTIGAMIAAVLDGSFLQQGCGKSTCQYCRLAERVL